MGATLGDNAPTVATIPTVPAPTTAAAMEMEEIGIPGTMMMTMILEIATILSMRMVETHIHVAMQA